MEWTDYEIEIKKIKRNDCSLMNGKSFLFMLCINFHLSSLGLYLLKIKKFFGIVIGKVLYNSA